MRAFPDKTIQQEEALKEQARENSKNDLHYLAKHLLGYNKITDHIHKRMAKDIDTPRYRFKLLLWPRGHYKSTLATESFSVQKLLRDPDERILITNVKLDNSRKFMRTIASHFKNNPKFRWAWRDWWLNEYSNPFHKAQMKDKLDWVMRDTQDELILLRPGSGREASITTGAVDASMVSQHYSTIIADDLINREYVRTQEMVDKSITYFRDLLDLLDPDGDMVVIGTRWSHVDLYSWIINEFGHKASMRVPEGVVDNNIVEASEALEEDKKDWMISIMPTNPENPIFPEEFTKGVLDELLRAKGPYEFGAQYLLNPTPAEHQKFHKEWINWYDKKPDVSNLTTCITVDPAVSLNDEADRTAIVVCGYDKSNRMYLLDGINDRLHESELLDELYRLAMKYSTESRFLLPIGFESVGFQQTYIYNFERIMMERGKMFAVEPIKRRSKQSKEERILRLVPRLQSGFYAPRTMVKQSKREGEYDLVQRLLWELTKFPFAGHDDLADALADQLDIIHASKLPVATKREDKDDKVVEFVHPSMIEDQKPHLRRNKKYGSVGAVR